MSVIARDVPSEPLAPLTVREAAFVLSVNEKRVNQAIDRSRLRSLVRQHRRGVKAVRMIRLHDLCEYAVQERASEYAAFTTAGRRTLHAAMQQGNIAVLVGDAMKQAIVVSAQKSAAPDSRASALQEIIVGFRQTLAHLELEIGPGWRLALSPMLEPLLPMVAEIAASRLAVESDPSIRGGEPVVRGTRVPVYRLAELKALAVGDDVLLADHPSLTPDLLRDALRYAELHPRVGRPKLSSAPWHAEEPVLRLPARARQVSAAARKAFVACS